MNRGATHGICEDSAHRAEQFMVADAKDVTILDGLALDTLTAELDAVRGAHIDHVEIPSGKFHEGMLPGDVGVANGEIRTCLTATDNEAILCHLKWSPLVVDCELLSDRRCDRFPRCRTRRGQRRWSNSGACAHGQGREPIR